MAKTDERVTGYCKGNIEEKKEDKGNQWIKVTEGITKEENKIVNNLRKKNQW